MPQCVRNFWIEVQVDGKQERIATGPRSKDGGFEVTISMRDRGGIIKPLKITGCVNASGTVSMLELHAWGDGPSKVFEKITER